MRLLYNPSHVTNRLGPWKGFLTGSLILSSIAILVSTESELVFLGMLGFILLGIALFFESILRQGEEIPFLTIIVMFVLGCIIAVIFAALGLQYLYFLLSMILVILTYTPRRKVRKIWKR